MAHSQEFNDLYSEVVTCSLRCTGVRNDPDNGIIGRSFYCPNESGGVEILLVSKNPGISNPGESDIYAQLNGQDRVKVHEEFVHSCFVGTNPLVKSRYHANIIRWVSVILGVPAEHDAVFSRVAMTQLVKCESSICKTDPIPDDTKIICAEKYFYRELELLRPKFLLALGVEVYKYLIRPHVADKHGLPVGKLYHPSWTNMRGGETRYIAEDLPRLRAQFLQAIDN